MLAVLLIGWAFILIYNNGHLRPPVVIVALSYLAIVAAIYNLFRTGATAVEANDEDDGDAAWGLPLGARGELEREKRTLLKAIKEAEFDHQMGKLSKKDVDDMVRTYRLRAIEVIKLLEDPGTKKGGTPREQIEREVRARIEVQDAGRKKGIDLTNRKNKKKAAEAAKVAARAAAAAGASGEVAAKIAADAAVKTDEEDDDEIAEAANGAAAVVAKAEAPEPDAANGAKASENAQDANKQDASEPSAGEVESEPQPQASKEATP